MRLKLICCGMFEREVRSALVDCPNEVHLELLPANLHQLTPGEILRGTQNLVNLVDRSQFQAVLVFCGACKASLAGLQAGAVPIVLPRAQDCISLLLDLGGVGPGAADGGPKSFSPSAENPEAGFWMVPVHDAGTRGIADLRRNPTRTLHSRNGFACGAWLSNARRAKNRTGTSGCDGYAALGARPAADSLSVAVRWRKPWPRSRPLPLLQRLVNGYWSHDDFLVVPPGWTTVAKGGRNQLTAEELNA